MDYTNKMKIIFGDVTLGIHGEAFHYIFSYQKGGLESLRKYGKEWLYRIPRLHFGEQRQIMTAGMDFR